MQIQYQPTLRALTLFFVSSVEVEVSETAQHTGKILRYRSYIELRPNFLHTLRRYCSQTGRLMGGYKGAGLFQSLTCGPLSKYCLYKANITVFRYWNLELLQ